MDADPIEGDDADEVQGLQENGGGEDPPEFVQERRRKRKPWRRTRSQVGSTASQPRRMAIANWGDWMVTSETWVGWPSPRRIALASHALASR